jgi:hypothetical protein
VEWPSPIDGDSVDATGRHIDDVIELTIEGVKKPPNFSVHHLSNRFPATLHDWLGLPLEDLFEQFGFDRRGIEHGSIE